jgi:hypothetical protein
VRDRWDWYVAWRKAHYSRRRDIGWRWVQAACSVWWIALGFRDDLAWEYLLGGSLLVGVAFLAVVDPPHPAPTGTG